MLSFSFYRSVWLPVSSKMINVVVAFQRKAVYLSEFLNCWRANVLKKMSSLLPLLLLAASSSCFCEQNYFPTYSSTLFFFHFFWGGGACCDLMSIIVCYCRLNNSVLLVEYVIIFQLNKIHLQNCNVQWSI